jgi:hypothetical protein
MSSNQQTHNHETIRLWIEDRKGKPASVASTQSSDDVGLLRVWFPGQGSGEQLDELSWDDFFAKFDEANLSFLYETLTTDGELSRFSKFVSRS